jgi:bifunctional DNase/RNase
MAEGENRFVPVRVTGLVRDQRGNPVVLLAAEDEEKVLPIWIGHAEGIAIELHLKGEKFERPLTHDLLRTTLESLGASVARVVVTELRENTFFAKIYLERENEVYVIDARPSDSIALALKTGAPMFVSQDVLANNRRSIQSGGLEREKNDEELRRYLEDLDPGDF